MTSLMDCKAFASESGDAAGNDAVPLGSSPMIETPRLVLRPFRLTDRDALVALFSGPEVMRFSVSGPKPAHDILDDLDGWVAEHRPTNPERWAVTQRGSDECLGFCGFSFHPVAGEWVWELGYRLLPSVWGQGLATEAAVACRDWFFATTTHDKFVLMIDPANVASVRIAEKIGARYEFDADCYGLAVGIYISRRATIDRYSGSMVSD